MKLALLVLFSACATEAGSPDVTARTVTDCDTWGCGTNSPTVGDGLLFDELDSSGAPNANGLSIVGATLGDRTTPLKLSVKRHFLTGTSLTTGATYEGHALEGTIIKLHHATLGDYELRIARYDDTSLGFWAGDPKFVPFYALEARRAGDSKAQFAYACKSEIIEPAWSGVEHYAIIFEGDRYDPVHKTVRDSQPGDPVFNVACAATTPAKLHLRRHTNAGAWNIEGVRAYPTTVDQRQTLLKLLTADYCGDGTSYTIQGQPLFYNDTTGWWPTETGTAPEAIWKANGAICLDTPRYADRSTVTCGLPWCSDVQVSSWSSYGYAISELAPPR